MKYPKGKLLLAGGKENKGPSSGDEPVDLKQGNSNTLEILETFVKEMKGNSSLIEIITTATNSAEELAEDYKKAFKEVGFNRCKWLDIQNRNQTLDPNIINRIRKADGVWFTGGDQMRLTTILGGTKVLKVLQELYQERDFMIAGTSAGAAAASDAMINRGTNEESLLRGGVHISPGFSFITNLTIDTHFVSRGRFGRIFQLVIANPAVTGLGLGEDTGVLIRKGRYVEVIGSGNVIIVDGHKIGYNNITMIEDGSPLTVTDLLVHVLSRKYRYDLEEHQFILPDDPQQLEDKKQDEKDKERKRKEKHP